MWHTISEKDVQRLEEGKCTLFNPNLTPQMLNISCSEKNVFLMNNNNNFKLSQNAKIHVALVIRGFGLAAVCECCTKFKEISLSYRYFLTAKKENSDSPLFTV